MSSNLGMTRGWYTSFTWFQSCHDRMIHFESQHIFFLRYMYNTLKVNQSHQRISKQEFNKKHKKISKNIKHNTKDTNEMVKTNAAKVPKWCRWITVGDSAIAPKTLVMTRAELKSSCFYLLSMSRCSRSRTWKTYENMVPCWSMLIDVDRCWSSVWTWYLHGKPASRV